MGCGELAEGVGPNQDSITGVDDTTFDNAGYDSADEGHREGVVHVKFKRGFGVVVSMVRKDVEEGPNEIEAFTGDV